MITALRSKRNRPYLHTLVFVLLVSWISLTISATCTIPMPSAVTAIPDHMLGCSDLGTPKHTSKDMEDCTLKPCLDSQTHSPPDFNRLAKLNLPVLILALIWAFPSLLLSYLPVWVPRKTDLPPTGRQIPLIYLFCTLLN